MNAQSIFNQNDLSSFRAESLTQKEINKINNRLLQKNLSLNELKAIATSKGMPATELVILENRLSLTPQSETQLTTKNETEIEDLAIKKENALGGNNNRKTTRIFGSDIFTNSKLSFEPNQNLSTPPTYILGSGDELQVLVYGVQQFSQSVRVNKEGSIHLTNVGEINVSGLQFSAALKLIKKKVSRIYSSINSNQSQVSITLSKIKTIQVTMIGVKKPGNYSLSSLSTVFNALYASGGPSFIGSYRKIELIRAGELTKIIDLYDYIVNGDMSSNLNLQNDDIIRVPVYNKRIEILGNIKRPGLFELLEEESFNDLLKYCSGFTEDAYTKSIQMTRITETERKILNIKKEQFNFLTLNSGDIIKVDQVLDKYENKIKIQGAVYRPQSYELLEEMTILDLINTADGLTEDAFLQRAILIRQSDDLTKEIIGLDLRQIIAQPNQKNINITLKRNDELIISSIFELQEEHSVKITGSVMNTGTYPFIQNITLYDLIILSGGFKESASVNVEIARILISDSLNTDNNEAEIINLQLDKNFQATAKNILLRPYDVISVREMITYEMIQSISVIGEVLYPGTYVISKANEKIGDILERAGGLTDKANIESVRIIRNSKKITSGDVLLTIPIDFKKVLKKPNSRASINVVSGDKIIIEKIKQTTLITGAIERNSEIPITRNKRAKYYINSSGGFTEDAIKRKVYVINPNGITKKTRNFGLFKIYPKPISGSQVHVPAKDPAHEKKMSTGELVAITSILTSITGITIAIINLLKP